MTSVMLLAVALRSPRMTQRNFGFGPLATFESPAFLGLDQRPGHGGQRRA